MISSTFFNQCSNEPPTEPNQLLNSAKEDTGLNLSITGDSIKTKDKDKDKDKDKGGEIVPNAASQCQKVVNYWLFDHYENVPGKIVGIWPREERWSNVSRLRELKEKFGFNYMYTTLDWPYDNVVAAGYTPSNIMGGGFLVTNNQYQIDVQNRPAQWGYYTDEPLSNQNGTVQQVESMSIFFRTYYTSSRFNAGENIVSNANEIEHTVNSMMCTRYNDYPEWFDPDQRSLWTDFSEELGNFSMTWIGAHKDLSEYDNLIGHATNLGLYGTWLYQYEDNTDIYSNNNIETFSFFAWKWGWLTKVERKWTYVYECINQNPCNCDPSTLSSEWILVDKYPTYETRFLSY